MKYVALAVLFGVTALIGPAPSHAKDFHVRRILPKMTHVSWYAVAVTNFTAAPGLDETAAEMTRSIRELLAHSGPYPFKRSDDLNAKTVEIDSPPDFSFWKTRGVGLLVVTNVREASDGRLEVRFRLWNTMAERQVAGQIYYAAPEFKDQLALAVAGAIFEILDESYRSVLSEIDGR